MRQIRQISFRQHDLQELRDLKAQLQPQVQAAEDQLSADRSALKLQQAEADLKRKSLARAKRPAVPLSSVLAVLAELVPEPISLTQMAYSSRTITITGASDDASAATSLMNSLEKSGKFLQTTFGYARRAVSEKGQSADKSHTFVFEITTLPVLGLGVRDSAP
jgi:Tfp pilus assembly protein PilN